jgi:hypothetical protein
MDIRHDPDPASGGEFAVAQLPDLFNGIVPNDFGIAYCGIELSFDFHDIHNTLLHFSNKKAACPQKGKRRISFVFQREVPATLFLDRHISAVSERANISPW